MNLQLPAAGIPNELPPLDWIMPSITRLACQCTALSRLNFRSDFASAARIKNRKLGQVYSAACFGLPTSAV